MSKKKEFNGISDINLSHRKAPHNNGRFKEIDLKKKSRKKIKKFLYFLTFFALIVGALTYFFYGANFKINNQEKSINFNNEIFHANILNPKPGKEIPFKLLNLNFKFKKDLDSDAIEEVQEKAKGKIKIINTTNQVQRLRKETRFEVDGRIFKTFKSVILQPKSSVVRDAFADMPGEEYNLKKGLKMTIPGFKEAKDMDSYKKITGEIAEDFTGGFIGKKNIPNKDDLEKKKKELEKEIDSVIMVKVRNSLPKNFILNNDGIFKEIKYSTIQENDGLKLLADVNVNAIIFDNKDFLALITGLPKNKISDYEISSSAFLKFKTLDKSSISIDSLKKFSFGLTGEIQYKRKFNKDEFLSLVKGKTRAEAEKLIQKNYPEFDIEISIFPFWMRQIPNDLTKISFVD